MRRDLAGLVAGHPVLEGLPADVHTLVAGCARNVAFRPGEVIAAEGMPADTFFFLRARGRVALEVRTPGRRPLLVETLPAGSLLGWSWLFPPYRWHVDARALGPVGAIAVDAACLREKAEADPGFGYALMKRMSALLVHGLQATQLRLLDVYGRADAV